MERHIMFVRRQNMRRRSMKFNLFLLQLGLLTRQAKRISTLRTWGTLRRDLLSTTQSLRRKLPRILGMKPYYDQYLRSLAAFSLDLHPFHSGAGKFFWFLKNGLFYALCVRPKCRIEYWTQRKIRILSSIYRWKHLISIAHQVIMRGIGTNSGRTARMIRSLQTQEKSG